MSKTSLQTLSLASSLDKKFPQMQITYMETGLLKTTTKQIRLHTPAKIQKLAKFISVSRLICPVLMDKENRLVAGHARLEAAKLLGLKTIPAIRIEHLDEPMLRAFALADNQFSLNAGWDEKALKNELVFLSSVTIDYGLELTDLGFNTPEIDIRMGEDIGDGPEDAQMAIEAGKPAVTQLGHIWQLGPHKLLCADSRDRNAFLLLMGDEKASLVFSDPPYNVPIDGHVCGSGAIQHREFAMAAGEMTPTDFTAFLTHIFGLMRESTIDGSIHFICMDWRHLLEIQTASQQIGYETKNLCVWVKDNGGMGSLYRSRHELVFVYKSGSAPHVNNVELGKHGRYRTNVWEYPGINSIRKGRMEELAMHPTVKPVALVSDAIKDCSLHNSLVLDPFGGSGTTLIACELANRSARLIEIDPHYCDVTIRRWQKLTGDTATLASTGQCFDDLYSKEGGHD